MSIKLLAILFLISSPAYGMTAPQSGPYMDIGMGVGLAEDPITTGLGSQLSLGWWFGPYDDSYAVGKFTSVGVTAHHSALFPSQRTAALLEARMGIDLLVIALYGSLSVGGLWTTPDGISTAELPTQLGGRFQAGVGAKWRLLPYWGLTLKLDGGMDIVDTQLSGVFQTMLLLSFSQPIKTQKTSASRRLESEGFRLNP